MDTERLHQVVADALEIDPAFLTPTTERSQVPQWDSLKHLNLAVALEQEFGIELWPEDFDQLNSMTTLRELIGRKLKKI